MYNPFDAPNRTHFPSFFAAFSGSNNDLEESQLFHDLSLNMDARLSNKPIPEDIQKNFFELKHKETNCLSNDPENIANFFATMKDHSPTYEIQRKIRRKLRAQHELRRKQRLEDKDRRMKEQQSDMSHASKSTHSSNSYNNHAHNSHNSGQEYYLGNHPTSVTQEQQTHNQVKTPVENQSNFQDEDSEDDEQYRGQFTTPPRSLHQQSPQYLYSPAASQSFRYATQYYNNNYTVHDPNLLQSPPSRIILYDPSNDSPKFVNNGTAVSRSIQTNLTIAPHLTVKITVLSEQDDYNSSIGGMEGHRQNDNESHDTFESPTFKAGGLGSPFHHVQASPTSIQLSPSSMPFSPPSHMKPPSGKSTHNPFFSPIGKNNSNRFGGYSNPGLLQSPLLSPIHAKTPTDRFREQNYNQEFTPTKNSIRLGDQVNRSNFDQRQVELNDPQLFLSPIPVMKNKGDDTLLESPSTPRNDVRSGLVTFSGHGGERLSENENCEVLSNNRQRDLTHSPEGYDYNFHQNNSDRMEEDSILEAPFFSPIAPGKASNLDAPHHSTSHTIDSNQIHSKSHQMMHPDLKSNQNRNVQGIENTKGGWNSQLNATPEVQVASFISPVKTTHHESEMSDIRHDMTDEEYSEGSFIDNTHSSRDGLYENKKYPSSPSFLSPLKESPLIKRARSSQEAYAQGRRENGIVRQLDFQADGEEQSSYHMSSDSAAKLQSRTNSNHASNQVHFENYREYQWNNQKTHSQSPRHPYMGSMDPDDNIRSWKQYDPLETPRFTAKSAPFISGESYIPHSHNNSVPDFISPVKTSDITNQNSVTGREGRFMYHYDRENYSRFEARRPEYNTHPLSTHGSKRSLNSSRTYYDNPSTRLPISRAHASAMYAITTPVRSPLSPINYSYIKSKILSPM